MDRRYRFEGTNTYELELKIDELVEDDILEPIVLVKEFSNKDNNKQEQVNLLFMPKLDPDEDLESAVGGGSDVEGCIIDDEEVDVDDSECPSRYKS